MAIATIVVFAVVLAACALSALWIAGSIFYFLDRAPLKALLALVVPPFGIAAAVWFLISEGKRE